MPKPNCVKCGHDKFVISQVKATFSDLDGICNVKTLQCGSCGGVAGVFPDSSDEKRFKKVENMVEAIWNSMKDRQDRQPGSRTIRISKNPYEL